MSGTVLEARDVVVSFGRTPALRGASLAVTAGEILAVMGPSGSGKSTLLHCLAGILVPDEGEILEDLLVAALNDARGKAEQAAQERMSELTKGLPLPPGMKLPF